MHRTYPLWTKPTARVGRRGFLAGVASTAAIAGTGLGASGAGGRSRQASPAATPDGGAEDAIEALAGTIQFVHPEKVYFYLPGMDEAGIAALYGTDVETYRAVRARFDAAARGAAEELLADRAFAERVDRLPFRAGQTVIGIGESDMDDLQSWLEILRHLLELRRPDDGIAVVNLGTSGQSTGEGLARFPAQLQMHEPNWVIAGLGGNDAVRNGLRPTKTRVSVEETAKNLAEIRHVAVTQSWAELVWVSRWPIDEARIAAFPPFQQSQFAIRVEDWAAVNEAIRGLPGTVVNLEPVFGQPPPPDFLIADGLHPSLAGHQAITRALVEGLTA
jgi:lysophospholipase L1-like esterase